ncbi:hypothetical protein AB7W40_19735 [Providencia rettgeri]
MPIYVYSTLTNDQSYGVTDGRVFIAGQANVMTKHMYTPRGRVTEISDEQYRQLKANHVFKLHVENGFIAVESQKEDPEKVATNMEASDASAPDTPESLDAEKQAVPKSNKNRK